MNRMVAAYLAGLVFGLGLIVAQMTDPAKVIAFLDITGRWDPSLALVMGGGLGVFGVTYAMTRSRARPHYAPAFVLPSERVITRPLILGSVLFGIGWALAGLCPGPAVVSAAFGQPKAWVFILAMLGGMQVQHLLARVPSNQEDPAAAAD